ncbi:inactive pancreatic lipase-related protein 1-like [Notolabrus celidotus]|uniref:inactive pancreatic lipase-related protein 1-like n=1 Tax=Notolabrus celidotus TaxID=1203425 RepID=UPI0014905BDA|nr:inactive pancreatic lipase-related protein 1-like [Notolabrus celidotus]
MSPVRFPPLTWTESPLTTVFKDVRRLFTTVLSGVKMVQMWSLGLLCLLVGASYAAEVCYDEVGCFDDLPPWGGTAERPASILPWDPEMIGTRFLLYTQRNRYYQEIKADKTIEATNYSGLSKTRFVIPGYLQKGEEDWPRDMCKVMVSWEKVNCVAVEWKKGVMTSYARAANNARVVAVQVADMIDFLMTKFKQSGEKFHIIGHSVGAHAAGDVGSRISGIARITGLDPTEPYFQGANATVRLDTSDALFVDVIHTDALPYHSKLGLGMTEPVGHIDFYPNGGELMSGCSSNRGKPSDLDAFWEGSKKFDTCNHVRAYQYYSESIVKPKGFVGFPCSDKDSFAKGKCFPCADKCPLMGHFADKFPLTDGFSKTKYFLNTGETNPFGTYSYKMLVTIAGPSYPNQAFMYVALAGEDESTKEYRLHVGTMMPGRTYELLIDAEVDVGDVAEVKFRWNNHHPNIMNPKYGASRVELQRGRDNKISHFCGTNNVEEMKIQSVLPCPV